MDNSRTLLLYADDNPDDRILVRGAMAGVLPDVLLHCVEDGQALLDYLQQLACMGALEGTRRPSVILLDQIMPRKDGFATLRALKADPRFQDTPVVMMSTSARPEDVQRAYDLGAAAFVRKPRSHAGLVQVLKSMKQFWSSPSAPPEPSDLRKAS